MSGNKNKDIIYGNIELSDDEFEPQNVKIRVTTFLDSDILLELKKRAKNNKSKYQTLLNTILRAAVFGENPNPPSEARMRQIAKEVVAQALKRKY